MTRTGSEWSALFLLLRRVTWKEKPFFQFAFTDGKLENTEKQTNSAFVILPYRPEGY